MTGRTKVGWATFLGVLLAPMGLSAQAMVVEADTFDPNRALLNDTPMFDAFYPESTTRLADALRDRDVSDDTGVLVLDVDGTQLALVTRQMAYHHVAQGDIAGEPWLVTF